MRNFKVISLKKIQMICVCVYVCVKYLSHKYLVWDTIVKYLIKYKHTINDMKILTWTFMACFIQ